MNAASASGRISGLDTSQVKTLGIGAIAVVVIVGLIAAYLVTKIVTKIIVLAVMVVLGLALYNQRSKVLDALDKSAMNCNVSFFNVHVQPTDATIKKACEQLAKQQHK
jgi:hypothetical protein